MLPLITGGYLMAIFSRLVLMIFAILFSAGIGGAMAASLNPLDETAPIFGAAIGGAAGIFIGRSLGNMVVGKPPQS
jgi:hypothetical protein